mgnify:CR=1 FL=1
MKENKILLFVVAVVLTAMFTPVFTSLYKNFFGPASGGFFWTSSSTVLEGFVFSFLFVGSLLSWLFGAEKKKKYWLFYTLPFLVLMLLLGAFEELIIGLGLVLLGWLLAQGVLAVKARVGK